MSDEHLSEARRRLMDFAGRAVAVARTASAATSATAAKAAATANAAAARAKAAATTGGRARVSGDVDATDESDEPENRGELSGQDERDETIARLEQEIAAERTITEQLAGEVKAFEFKLQILERSYGKQLADARADADAAKQELSELKRLLADTTQELKRVTAIKDRLRDMFAFDGRRVPPELRDQQTGDEDTIARLLAMTNAMPEPKPSTAEAPPEHADSEPEAAGDLLSPELVFDSKDDGERDVQETVRS